VLIQVNLPLGKSISWGDKVMNLNSESRSARFYALSVAIVVILICAWVSAAFAQERSENRDNPTLLTSNKVNDDLDGSDAQYFYKFTAGPGKLTVTFEVKASGTNAGAMLDLFDAKSRPILSDVLAQGVDGGSERIVNNVQLNGKREIVMRIKGLKYGDSGGTGAYTITLDGADTFAQGAAPTAPAPAAGAPAPPVGGGGAAAPAGANLVSGPLNPADDKTILNQLNITGLGPVTFSFSVKATDKNAGARFSLLDEKGKVVWVPFEVFEGQSTARSLTFPNDKSITIVVQAIKIPDNAGRGTYSVQLSGPVTVVVK
jgi:hypothetical protein